MWFLNSFFKVTKVALFLHAFECDVLQCNLSSLIGYLFLLMHLQALLELHISSFYLNARFSKILIYYFDFNSTYILKLNISYFLNSSTKFSCQYQILIFRTYSQLSPIQAYQFAPIFSMCEILKIKMLQQNDEQ